MSTEATVLFIIAALAFAAFMLVSSIVTSRHHRAEAERARARAEEARLQAEVARRRRIDWEERIALQREAMDAADGARVIEATHRFRRVPAVSAPAPRGRARPLG